MRIALTALGALTLSAFSAIVFSSASPTTARGLYQFLGEVDPANAANPNLDGSLIVVTWSQIEPSKGAFDWSPIDNGIAPWVAANKRFALRVQTASSTQFNAPWNASTNGNATPAWVYGDGARSVAETDGSVLPVYWDAPYQQDLQSMVQALAARYATNASLAFVEAATGFDGESFVDGTGNSNKLALWQAVGYTDNLWENTAFAIWDIYQQAFGSVPLAPELKGGQISGSNVMPSLADHAIAKNMWVNHNGLDTTAYGGTYQTELSKAGQATGLVLEEKSQLSIDGAGATNLITEVNHALAVSADFVLVYPAEAAAATSGSSSYSTTWDTAIAQAHALINGTASPTPSPTSSPTPSPSSSPSATPTSSPAPSSFQCVVVENGQLVTSTCTGTHLP